MKRVLHRYFWCKGAERMKVDKTPPAATCSRCREDDADGRGDFYRCCQEKLKDAAAGLLLHVQLRLHEGSCRTTTGHGGTNGWWWRISFTTAPAQRRWRLNCCCTGCWEGEAADELVQSQFCEMPLCYRIADRMREKRLSMEYPVTEGSMSTRMSFAALSLINRESAVRDRDGVFASFVSRVGTTARREHQALYFFWLFFFMGRRPEGTPTFVC